MYSGVVVDAGRITDMPHTLKLDAVSETVHVSADATPLETPSNQVATTVRNDTIIDLPLAARDAHLRVVVGRLRSGTTANNGTFNGLFEIARTRKPDLFLPHGGE